MERKDILIVFSYSGNTSELTNMLKYANRFRIKIIGVASKSNSLLLKASDIKLLLPKALRSGKSIGFSTVPPLWEKLNLMKKKFLFANSLPTKFHAPQSLNPL